LISAVKNDLSIKDKLVKKEMGVFTKRASKIPLSNDLKRKLYPETITKLTI
jgi:hypothetical protein